jgi:hypothetical protein
VSSVGQLVFTMPIPVFTMPIPVFTMPILVFTFRRSGCFTMVRSARSRWAEIRSSTPAEERLDCLAVEPESAADPHRQKLISLAQLVDQSSADAETGRDFPNGQEPFVRTGIRQNVAHHRRTKLRLNVSAFC